MQVRNQFGAVSAFVGNGGLDARLKAEVVAVGTAAGKNQGVVLLPSFLMDGQANHAKSRRCGFVRVFVCFGLHRAGLSRATPSWACAHGASGRRVQSPTIDLATLWLTKVTQACALLPCAIPRRSPPERAHAACVVTRVYLSVIRRQRPSLPRLL